jgi:hypothetical protein
MSSEQQQYQQQQSFNDSYTALILEEAEKIYVLYSQIALSNYSTNRCLT